MRATSQEAADRLFQPDPSSSRTIFQPLLSSNLHNPDDAIPEFLIPNDTISQTLQEVVTFTDEDARPTKRRKLSPPPQEAAPSTADSSLKGTIGSKVDAISQQSFTSASNTHRRSGSNVYKYGPPPPTVAELVASIDHYGIPSKIYRDPYYSKESDAPERPREYAGLVFHLKGGDGIANLEEWKPHEDAPTTRGLPPMPLSRTGVGGWEYAGVPPSVKEVRKWLQEYKGKHEARRARKKDSSQVRFMLAPRGHRKSLHVTRRLKAPLSSIHMG